MEIKTYKTVDERTKAQFEAMSLKQRGYNVTRIIRKVNNSDGTEEEQVVAFGYKLSPEKQETKSLRVGFAKEEDYDFIYWNL